MKNTLLTILLAITLNTALASRLPDLGSPSQNILSPQQETQLTKQFMAAINRKLTIIQDPIINDYINTLGYKLIAHSPNQTRAYHFFVIKNTMINAFSGPGGYIGVFSGLILKTKTESELASVISHELAHAVQEHIPRGMAQQNKLQLSNIATMLAAIALGAISPNAAMGLMSAAQAGSYQSLLNYSRSFEKEADRIGINILAQSGFDPYSMPSFLKRLQKESQLNGDNTPPLLRSHPLTEERLADTINRCAHFPKHHYANNPEFNLIQARLAVAQAKNSFNTVRKYKKSFTAHQNSTPLHYAYTLALLKNNQTKQARAEIHKLIQAHPDELMFKITEVDIEHAANNDKKALKLLSELYLYNPGYYPVTINYANLLINNHQAKKASQLLAENLDDNEKDESYLALLSKAQALSGNQAAAFQTRANMCMLYNDRRCAIGQLNVALSHVKHNDRLKKQIQHNIALLSPIKAQRLQYPTHHFN